MKNLSDVKALERRRIELEQLRRIGSITYPIKYHFTLRGKIGPKVLTVRPEFYYYDNRSQKYAAEFLPTSDVRECVKRWLVCSYRGAVMREVSADETKG